MPDENDPDQHEVQKLVHDEISSRIERQDLDGTQVDNKATVLIGVSAAAAQYLATKNSSILFASIAFGMYGLAFVSAVMVISIRRYRDLRPAALIELLDASKEDVLHRLIAIRIEIYQHNSLRYRHKAIYWRISIAALTTGLITSTSAIALGR
ncbi:hypothetical protein V5P93_000280 [Actinokineospora auranticolor]|uniref:hypothetical protein n=1 Tax=Actinokineospora auranticolor TaxID=155976 RepID=UPI0011AFDE45|nr:hypothetical protein [Actinokineospora auranticolor]